ncbi:hypothetical protein CL6EHI_083140 [Entamoeba histolytica]|uniref:Calponin-homology (CH) domain-containing protein n=1 Tax=Entamoeba histolytica TaxID=5759 RepID=A0A175JUA5_ENTHI|nr:hypothetical protein CL6EHI_083140 [Entamoeba histolytica]
MSQQQGNNKEAGWVRVQIQLFTLWMDEVLQQRQMGVKDLAVDLKDGIRVINFFELLSGKTLKEKYDLRPKNRIQMVHNLHLAMQFLEKEMLVRNPGCFAEDVVDADIHGVKLILGLLYTLYRKYRLSVLVDKKKGKSMKEEDALLEWVKEVTDGYGVTVENFKHSFNDGKVYLALAHVIKMKEKEGESMASKFVEENKRSAELGDKKTDLVEEIEELEEEVSVLKKTVQTAQDDCDEDKKDLEKAGELQKLYLNIQPLEENLRRQIVDLHKWAPYLKSEEGFGQEDPKLKTLNEPKEGDYKEVFKEMAEDLEKENDEVGKILVQLKKEQLQKEQKKTAKVGVKKPVVKKDKK